MLNADTITDEQIRELRDRSCECRDAWGWKPRIGDPDGHAAIHDCDVEVFEICVIALGMPQVLASGSVLDPTFATWTPNVKRNEARARCAEILNARNLETK